MLAHHEPNDFTSLSAEERAAVVQAAIRRAHAERAKAVANMVKGLGRRVAFWRADRGGNAERRPPNYARHA